MRISKEKLLNDLYIAFYDARKNKANKQYVKDFEEKLHENLLELTNCIYNKTYCPLLVDCFIIGYPKPREVYASQFRDRIVQHLYYNYTYDFYYKTFIADTYSCIVGRGTHYGIKRLKHHILSESNNYKEKCYYLKLDIKGYFMHINRDKLLNIANKTINKYEYNDKYQNLDFDLIKYLTKEIISLDVTKHSTLKGYDKYYKKVPLNKILALTDSNCGLPIGNLSSQLFSNVYMNVFDQYIKRELKCKHYGRYVDDAYIISKDKNFLLSIILKIKKFLKEKLDLDLHEGKLILKEVKYGIEFLGAFIKPFRTYISNQTLKRMKKHIEEDKLKKSKYQRLLSNTSRIGILSHYKSYNIKKKLFYNIECNRY